ncbi:MAG TPA: hypothetical protein VNN79_23495, partial [Actinomycetota bacterium]|nr:hypothetical protein [Actinomycetota bacterium]
ADLPDQVGALALLVYPPSGPIEIGASQRRNDLYTFPVRLLRDPLSVPARTRWLYAWYDAIHDKIATTHIALGITPPPNIDANVVEMRAEIDGAKYSSVDGTFTQLDVVELTVQVLVNEHVPGITV